MPNIIDDVVFPLERVESKSSVVANSTYMSTNGPKVALPRFGSSVSQYVVSFVTSLGLSSSSSLPPMFATTHANTS
jgi:hypothetical protein